MEKTNRQKAIEAIQHVIWGVSMEEAIELMEAAKLELNTISDEFFGEADLEMHNLLNRGLTMANNDRWDFNFGQELNSSLVKLYAAEAAFQAEQA